MPFPIIPYKHISISTGLSQNRAVAVVSKAVSSTRHWKWRRPKDARPFEGSVFQEGFKISRAIYYRNSFLPMVHGKFILSDRGVIVDVHMILHPFVIVFALLWCGGVGVDLINTIRQAIEMGSATIDMLFPLGMFLFFYLMVSLGFGFEAQRAERLLDELFAKYRC